MDRSEWAANAYVDIGNGKRWVLKYYVHTYGAGRKIPLYGLRVDKCPEENSQPIETEMTPALTASHAEMLTMARVFAKGSVPPCVLLEMADEWFMQRSPAHTYHMAG
jgi:hypothetical protein